MTKAIPWWALEEARDLRGVMQKETCDSKNSSPVVMAPEHFSLCSPLLSRPKTSPTQDENQATIFPREDLEKINHVISQTKSIAQLWTETIIKLRGLGDNTNGEPKLSPTTHANIMIISLHILIIKTKFESMAPRSGTTTEPKSPHQHDAVSFCTLILNRFKSF